MKKMTLFSLLISSCGALFGMEKNNTAAISNNSSANHIGLHALKSSNNNSGKNEQKDYNRIPSDKSSFSKNHVAQPDLSPRGTHDLPI